MATEVVRTSGLSRSFDGRPAVDDLTLSVHAGEVLCLLGPNGAGKTTTFRMLAALLLPTRGEVVVAGTPLTPDTADQVRRRVGLLTEAPGLWERLTVRTNLLTYARLHGVPDEAGRVTTVMRDVGIDDRADDRAGALSKGLKQRVAIARALVHDPPVVLLDEPTSGLDPANARHVRDLIGRLRADGRGVLVSTHNLAEAEELADRIAILNTRLLACDTPRRLREQRRGGTLDHRRRGTTPRSGASWWCARGRRSCPRMARVWCFGCRRRSTCRRSWRRWSRRARASPASSRAMPRSKTPTSRWCRPMPSRWRRIAAIVRKDADEMAGQPGLILPAVAMVLGLSLPAFLLLVITPAPDRGVARRLGVRGGRRGRDDHAAGVERTSTPPARPRPSCCSSS